MAIPEQGHPFGQMIYQGWKDSGLSLEEVVFRYKTEATRRGYKDVRGLGAVKGWCYAKTIPPLHQYDVLATVLDLPRINGNGQPDRIPDSERAAGASTDSARPNGHLRIAS